MALCFSCFMVKILKDFRVMAIGREKTRRVPLKAIPTCKPTALANVPIETLPIINCLCNWACVHDACDCIESLHLFGKQKFHQANMP